MQQIATENHLHPVQVTQWKTQMMESASGVFARGKDREQQQACSAQEKERLERKVGQLAVEVDWLKKVQGIGDRSMRKTMAEKSGCAWSVRCQCELPGVNRNRLECGRDGALSPEEQILARRIDEVHRRFPEFGARRIPVRLHESL